MRRGTRTPAPGGARRPAMEFITLRASRLLRLVETSCFFALLVMVALRPLIAESYDSGGSAVTAAMEQLSDPSPVRTLLLDVVILMAAAGSAVVRRLIGATPYRRGGLEAGWLLLVIAGAASCLYAGNKRLAINGTIDWLCLPVLAIALTQLLDSPGRRRLLLAVVLASATVQSFQCLEQYLSFDDTWRQYVSMREEFWARQNVPLDSPRVEAFERRIQSREASGFLPHANVAGSHLVMCTLVAIGLVLGRWRPGRSSRERVLAAGATLLVAILIVGLALTKSLGAVFAGVAGAAVWLALSMGRGWISAHRRAVLIAGCAVAALVVLAVVAYGVTYDRLPGWSLTFRWQYWTASAEMIADHPLTGVGRENFGRHYLAYKSIQSPEEVSNPHNLFVQAAAEWGLPGLIAVVLMLIGASASALAAVTTDERDASTSAASVSADESSPMWWGRWLVALLGTLLAARFLLLGTGDLNFLYYATVTTGIVWSLGFVIGVAAGPVGGENTAAPRILRMAVVAGLASFLVHDLINFASFIPGSATTAFALAAFILSGQPGKQASPRGHAYGLFSPMVAISASGVVVVLMVGLIPVLRSLTHTILAQRNQTIYVDDGRGGAWSSYRTAAAADPLDPTPCVKQAEWLMRMIAIGRAGPNAWNGAEAALLCAVSRDPFSHALRRMQMRFYVERAAAHGDIADRWKAVDSARMALSLYPENPEGLITLADRERETAEALLQADAPGPSALGRDAAALRLIDDAVANYRAGLWLDTQRLWWEELHRLRDVDREKAEDHLVELLQLRESLLTE